MKIVILAVGKLKDHWVLEGCAEYLQRLRRHATIQVVEVKEGTGLAARIPTRHRVVALTERGQEPTSAELAERVGRWQMEGVPGVVFLIGGADGLPAEIERQADERLSLSRLTLPHRLARLVLLEQLYRAFSILRGEPYHRA
jgi:23S rRNA (pseudouridine1915-N3)-methyltransferase